MYMSVQYMTLAQNSTWCWQHLLFKKSGRIVKYKKDQQVKKFKKFNLSIGRTQCAPFMSAEITAVSF